MPFGLKIFPAIFQRIMDITLSSVRWQFTLLYLDNVVIRSGASRKHISHKRHVLSFLKEAGFTLRLEKCTFFKNNVAYSNHFINPGQLEVANHITDAIREVRIPPIQTEIRSFIGFLQLILPDCPEFRLHQVSVGCDIAHVAGKGACGSKQRIKDSFADLTEKTYFSTNMGLTQEGRTVHPRPGCASSPNRVRAIIEGKR